jgi:CRAL/TRIO domain
MDLHYPGRVRRLMIVNAPYWFSSVWGMVGSILPDSVKKKIKIIAGVKGLDEVISPSQRPVQYGGTDVELGSSPDHLRFIAVSEAWGEEERTPVEEAPPPQQWEQQSSHEGGERGDDEGGGLMGWLNGLGHRSEQAYLGDKNQ